jgi:hypothetical protein
LRVVAALILAASAAPGVLAGDVVTHRVGRLTIRVDTRHAHPGGLFVVSFRSRARLGALSAIFEGRRAPSYPGPRGLEALVPIPFETPPGSWTLGVALEGRRGVQHFKLQVPVAERDYPTRSHAVSPASSALVGSDAARRDGRRLLVAMRELSPRSLRTGPFRPPAGVVPNDSFGAHEERGGTPVERTSDGTWGERQRTLEYPVAPGSAVGAPAGGTVVLAERLTLTGGTLVIDHGEGLVSALHPLDRLALHAGDSVVAGQRVGVSGLDPLGDAPRVEWGLYLHGIAVDPRIVIAVDPTRAKAASATEAPAR